LKSSHISRISDVEYQNRNLKNQSSYKVANCNNKRALYDDSNHESLGQFRKVRNAMPETNPANAVPDIPSNLAERQPTGEQHMPRGKTKMNGGGAAANGVGTNKMEAVRRALGALGHHAKPVALHSHILREFNLDIQPNMISSYKSTILKGKSTGKKRGRKPKSEVAAGNATSGVNIKDLKAIKELMMRLGAGHVRELLELLA
jgi:hypothetical protein